MDCKNLQASSFHVVSLLKTCAKNKDLYQGLQLHDDLRARGLLQRSPHVGSALVNMYAKCGAFAIAWQVLDELPVPNVVSWSALIAGYAEHGQGKEALSCYEHMQSKGLSPDAITYACILKACGIAKDGDKGKQIHDEMVCREMLEKSILLRNALVDMYVKCGMLTEAQEAFDNLPGHDIVSWNVLIGGYAQQGQGKKALACYERMQSDRILPNAITYTCILNACSIARVPDKGQQIHGEVVSQGLLGKDVMLGTALLDMYAKCGLLMKAKEVFNRLLERNLVSWNSLIGGFVQQGQGEEALNHYQRMHTEGVFLDIITYASILKACGMTRGVDGGKQIHVEITNQQPVVKNLVLSTALLDMYSKCGALKESQQVFDELPARDLFSWNTLIAGYAQQGQGKEALHCYDTMRRHDVCPNEITYTCVLKACSITRQTGRGVQIHDEVDTQGLLKGDAVLGNALVDMYTQCGLISKAQEVFNELPLRNAISWSALIAGYVQQNQGKEALDWYDWMRSEGFAPDAITYMCILRACSLRGEADRGEQIHNEIVSKGFLESNVVLGNALIDMYAKCGVMGKAQQVFNVLAVRDVISWSTLISGYVQQEQGKEALNYYQRMQSEGILSNAITYACILKACGITREVDIGKQIHDAIESQRFVKDDVVLGTALLDMYAKCGLLRKSQEVFDGLPLQNLVSWNALITGYAQQGQGTEALNALQRMRSAGFTPETVHWNAIIGGYAQQGLIKDALACFNWMQSECTSPDAITFTYLLHACSCSGLVDEGQMVFELMSENYGIIPEKEHHTHMAVLYGRSGHFDKALAVLKKVPSSESPSVWFALLGACQKWGNAKVGRLAYEHTVCVSGHRCC